MESEHPLIGQSLGAYHVEASLGAGAMGAVYFGRDTRIGRPVAIKVLHPHLARSPRVVERFRQEARVLGALAHPNIVMVLEFMPEAGAIVMEFLSGQTLEDFLATTPAGIPFVTLYPIFDQLGAALEHAHRRNVVHRDLKPSNVMLVELDGQTLPKVLDFGIAKITADAPAMTAVSSRLGTAWYMAPEQIRSASQVDARADVYALGVCLFHCATGRAPFPYELDFEAMRAHLEEVPARPSSLNATISAGLDEVILHAMAKDPAQRYPTAQAFRDALKALANDARIETLKTGAYRVPTEAELAAMGPAPLSAPDSEVRPAAAATLASEPPATTAAPRETATTQQPVAPAAPAPPHPAPARLTAITVHAEPEAATADTLDAPAPAPTRAEPVPTVPPVAGPSPSNESSAPPPRKSRSGLVFGVVAAVVVAGGGGAFWYTQMQSGAAPAEVALTPAASAPPAPTPAPAPAELTAAAAVPVPEPAPTVATSGAAPDVQQPQPTDVAAAPVAPDTAVADAAGAAVAAPPVAPLPTVTLPVVDLAPPPAPPADLPSAPEPPAAGGAAAGASSLAAGFADKAPAQARDRIALAIVPYVSAEAQTEATNLNTAGMTAYGLHEYATAFDYFVRATRANPGHRKAFYNAGCQAALLGNVDRAIEYLTGWVALRDDRNFEDMQRLVDSERDLDRIRSDPRYVAFRERILPE